MIHSFVDYCLKYLNSFFNFSFQVTFKDAESARRACLNPNPIIDERVANCNLASDDQFNIITGFRHDDLCHLSPTFMQHCQQQFANLHQPLLTYAQPYYWYIFFSSDIFFY